MTLNITTRVEKKLYSYRDRYLGKNILRFVKRADLNYGLYNGPKRNEQYVISMASYTGRYSTLPLTLKSLILQKEKADKIIVWLDEENDKNIPSNEMLSLCKYGVEFRHTYDDLKPHKKYLYAMQEYPDANIITVDDDVIYSNDMLESLIQYHKSYPHCVCARRVHKITFDSNQNVNPYMRWNYEYRKEKTPSYLLCATGCGGVLYPRNILPTEAYNIDMIKKFSLEADDIWLKVMELLNEVEVVWVKNKYVMPLELESTQEVSLNSVNVWKGRNDQILFQLFQLYPETYETLKKYID